MLQKKYINIRFQNCEQIRSVHDSPSAFDPDQRYYQHNFRYFPEESTPLSMCEIGIDKPPPDFSIHDRVIEKKVAYFVIDGCVKINNRRYEKGTFFMAPS